MDNVVGGPPDAGEVEGADVPKNLDVKVRFTQPIGNVIKQYLSLIQRQTLIVHLSNYIIFRLVYFLLEI